jgi:hypothetical protein
MNLLLLDLETSPNTAYVWGLWNENIPLARLIDTGEVMCWSAKWLGKDEIMFDSYFQSSPKQMIKRLHRLVDKADGVITYNGNRFDIPVMNKEFLLNKLVPHSYQQIDLYRTVKSRFRFASNKLDHICEELGIGKKMETDFRLWVNCMNKDPVAWKHMEEYNRHDVLLLEGLYYRLLPWVKNLPNLSVENASLVCPRCGSNDLISRGWYLTKGGKYKRYSCNSCGGPVRGNKAEKQSEKLYPL